MTEWSTFVTSNRSGLPILGAVLCDQGVPYQWGMAQGRRTVWYSLRWVRLFRLL